MKSKIEILEDFFRIIALARLQNKGLSPQRKSDAVLNEASRLERIYELYWKEALHDVDYYDGAAKFIASVVTANDKLVHLSERQLYIKKPKGEKNNIDKNQNKENNIVETQNNVTNNLMITMTTADLLNSILEKEMNKEAITVEQKE